jgi:hypothetical protein
MKVAKITHISVQLDEVEVLHITKTGTKDLYHYWIDSAFQDGTSGFGTLQDISEVFSDSGLTLKIISDAVNFFLNSPIL